MLAESQDAYERQSGAYGKLTRARHQIENLTIQASSANARAAEYLEKLEESRKSEIKATQTVADFVAQLKYGKKIFDHVPELPVSQQAFIPERQLRPQAKDVVRQAEQQFLAQLEAQAAQANAHAAQAQTEGYGTQ